MVESVYYIKISGKLPFSPGISVVINIGYLNMSDPMEEYSFSLTRVKKNN